MGWLCLAAGSRRGAGTSRLRDAQFALTEHGGREFYELCYADGTRFVLDGCATRVWGEAGPGLTDHDVLVYFLGPIMGFVMRQRGKLVLHASAVVLGDRAVAIMGPAGCGKSTTAAALALRGWPVLNEDVCALEMQEENSQVYRAIRAFACGPIP